MFDVVLTGGNLPGEYVIATCPLMAGAVQIAGLLRDKNSNHPTLRVDVREQDTSKTIPAFALGSLARNYDPRDRIVSVSPIHEGGWWIRADIYTSTGYVRRDDTYIHDGDSYIFTVRGW